MRPGEITPAHRHTASALRYIMEGKGAYTVVDGHKVLLRAHDLVLTPNGTWHDHGVVEDGAQCIWQDGLDIPMMNALEVNNYGVYPEKAQTPLYPLDDLPMAFGSPGLLPVHHGWTKGYSPLFRYGWEETYEALQRLSKVTEGDPYDGIIMRYSNPLTGGHIMKTMGATQQMLRPGEHTKAHQHTGNSLYQVTKGKGFSIINGQRFDWQEKDIFCVPSWSIHEHANASDTEDACLFSFNDFPTIEALGVSYGRPYEENGGYQKATQ